MVSNLDNWTNILLFPNAVKVRTLETRWYFFRCSCGSAYADFLTFYILDVHSRACTAVVKNTYVIAIIISK